MMSNDSNIDELRRSNAELNALLARLLTDTDALFNSHTWNIGYRVANSIRWLQRLLGRDNGQAHIGPDHFRKLADTYYSCLSRPSAVAAAAPVARAAPTAPTARHNDGIPEVPKDYVVSDVEVVIRGGIL